VAAISSAKLAAPSDRKKSVGGRSWKINLALNVKVDLPDATPNFTRFLTKIEDALGNLKKRAALLSNQ
jgi:hypothetical protein